MRAATTTSMRTGRRMADQRGVALILAMFLTAAASALGASLMYLSQTETYASNNYRVMTQARYGAESGIHRAINHLLNTYTPPTVAELAASYVTTTSPVTFNGEPVVLSANEDVASNYADAAQVTAFANGAGGTLVADHVNIAYAPSATLLSARDIGGTIVMTWEITSVGRITVGTSTAEVEVTAMLERQVIVEVDAVYAAFAVDPSCGAMRFTGNGRTASYDSSEVVAGNPPVVSNNSGNVGTNGNMTESGNAVINGTLSTPRVGVGSCSSGNVNALTSSGNAQVTGGTVQLPQTVSIPTPPDPNLNDTSTFSGNGEILLNGATKGNVVVTNNNTITLGEHGVTSTITVNSLRIAANAVVVVRGTVILNVEGDGQTNPIQLTGTSMAGSSAGGSTTYVASDFRVNYAGTGTVSIAGNGTLAAVINAPRAEMDISGNGDIYGALIGKKINYSGNGRIIFDRQLAEDATSIEVGNHMLSSFSWKKY